VTSKLHDRVKFTREAFDVNRCHTHPHLLRYSVGHHSAGVVSLVIQTWMEAYGDLPSSRLLVAALHHDAAELVTGDIPSPMKTLLGEVFEHTEAKIGGWLSCGTDALDALEREWLQAADSLELYLWCLEEVELRGNMTFTPWLLYYRERWESTPLPEPFMEIVKSYQGQRRLPWSTLKEIAGL
jgi:5'-deoxynucleotidase YfbR-like HD superfamily hydrolase